MLMHGSFKDIPRGPGMEIALSGNDDYFKQRRFLPNRYHPWNGTEIRPSYQAKFSPYTEHFPRLIGESRIELAVFATSIATLGVDLMKDGLHVRVNESFLMPYSGERNNRDIEAIRYIFQLYGAAAQIPVKFSLPERDFSPNLWTRLVTSESSAVRTAEKGDIQRFKKFLGK
jgi:hypothetical protein